MREGRLILRLVALALLVYALAGLCAAGRELKQTEEAALRMQRELDALDAENARLRQLLQSAQTEEGLRQLAEERLGMVMPDEIVFMFRDP